MSTETPLEEVLVTLPIDAIQPYWRNPRRVTPGDVAKLMISIEEFGYQNPIIVDTDHVIIAGHSRYLAVRRLGWTEVPVIVSDMDKHLAKQYRIIDNRAGEFTQWDRTALLKELQRFQGQAVMQVFFPEVDLTLNAEPIDWSNLAPPYDVSPPARDPVPPSKLMICPHCYHEFQLIEAKVLELLTDDEDEA